MGYSAWVCKESDTTVPTLHGSRQLWLRMKPSPPLDILRCKKTTHVSLPLVFHVIIQVDTI